MIGKLQVVRQIFLSLQIGLETNKLQPKGKYLD